MQQEERKARGNDDDCGIHRAYVTVRSGVGGGSRLSVL
jgi:hypothetical protein